MSPRERSFTDFDRSYRKGVVLGLSLAEVFIILVFLLLLALIGMGAYWEEAQMDILVQEGVMNELDEEKIKLVIRNSKLQKELDGQEEEIKKLNDVLGSVQEQHNNPGSEITNQDPQTLLANAEKRLTVLEQNYNQIKDILEDTKKQHAEQLKKRKEENAKRKQKLKELKEALKQGKAKLAATIKKDQTSGKGQDSPCWFKRETRNPEWEKPIYIFHIRIFDNHVFVKDIGVPAEYKGAMEELKKVFDRTKLDKKITFKIFLRAFKPLKEAGHSKKIRDRRCTFYVGLWNETTNREAYQRAKEDIVESIFISYRFRDEPWPHGTGN